MGDVVCIEICEGTTTGQIWRAICIEPFATVTVVPNLGTAFMHECHLQRFLATGPLKFVAVDFFGLLTKTAMGNQNVEIINDRNSKLTRAVPAAIITTTAAACIFFDACVILYCIPSEF